MKTETESNSDSRYIGGRKTSILYDIPTWDRIYDMLIELADAIKSSQFKPEVIVGVCRGGWPPARILSDLLENPNLASMRVEFYVNIDKRSKEPAIGQPLTVGVKGKRVLLVDDVSDTGKSLKVAAEHIRGKGAAEVKVATIFYKPHSITKPEFYMAETSAWIIFPWERLETTRLLVEKAKREGRDSASVEDELARFGFDRRLLRRFINMISDGSG